MDADQGRVGGREDEMNNLAACLEACDSIMQEFPTTTVDDLNSLIPAFAPYGETWIPKKHRGRCCWLLTEGREVTDWAIARTDEAARLQLAPRCR